jgi:hypothetical protein
MSRFRPNLPAARVPALQSFPWLHGTTNAFAELILKDGQLKPYRSIYTGSLAPLPGRVYLASDFGTAISYAVTGLEEDRLATEGVVFTCELLPGMDVVLDEDLAAPMGVVQYMEEKYPDLDWKGARRREEQEKFAIEHMDDEDTQLFLDSIASLRAAGRTALNIAVKGKVPVVAAYSWPRGVLLVTQKKRFVEARRMNPIARSKHLYESLISFATQIL